MTDTKLFKYGNRVIYIPKRSLSMEKENLGIVTSTNDKFVFVQYGNDSTSQATSPEDLYLLKKIGGKSE